MKALPSVSNPRRIILLLILSALILTVVFCSLSFLSFSSQLYIKRSPNTFVGDEKYQTVRQEVEMQLETFHAQGVEGVIDEQVIERVNSKNETTSLVIFTINAANNRSGWDLLCAGLPSSLLLILILAFSVAAWLLTLLSAFTGNRAAGVGAFALALAAFFLIPVVFNRLNLDDFVFIAGFLFREQTRNKIFNFSHDRHLRITLTNYNILFAKSQNI